MTDDQVAVADPATGELIGNLGTAPAERLAQVLFELRDRKRTWRAMEVALEDELRRRVSIRERAVFVFGNYEVSAKSANRSEWDADELERTLRELLDQGVLHAGELTEVIRHETTVNGSEANRLVARLSGAARDAVERCRTWRKDRPRVEVARSVELTPTPEG